ncbi:hypothetical protein FGLOB1_10614 [Fusarium globosum]|uniref:Apple domain-containing protein n=1 Tax=Fusarium globosum TaxID=78864 RepID=A0A8H5XVH5_9HYPO|nr:hypothetical protein FGLOB1_10614 [Fusarium globosum]
MIAPKIVATIATDAASVTGTTISGTIATTTVTILTPSSTGYTRTSNENTRFPASVLYDAKGDVTNPDNIHLITVPETAIFSRCRDTCRGSDDCIAFVAKENVFCDLLVDKMQETDGSNTDWNWYSLDCFCDLPELPTNLAVATTTAETTDTTYLAFDIATTYTTENTALTTNTATTEVETSSTVLTTSSAKLATSTETTAAFGCPGDPHLNPPVAFSKSTPEAETKLRI